MCFHEKNIRLLLVVAAIVILEQLRPGSGTKIRHSRHTKGNNGKGATQIARWNEKCGPHQICNGNHGLICADPGYCRCPVSHTYSPDRHKCLPVTSNDDESCHHRDQCVSGIYGEYSFCNETTNVCQCTELHYGVKVIRFDNNSPRCVLDKTFNSTCSVHEECKLTMSQNGRCHDGKCACDSHYVWDPESKDCLPIAKYDIHSGCVSDIQCTKSSLGDWAECNLVSGKCSCKYNREGLIFYYEPTRACYQKKAVGDWCQSHAECVASIGNNSLCTGEQNHFKEEMQTCQCIPGVDCEFKESGGSRMSNGWIPISLSFVIVISLKTTIR